MNHGSLKSVYFLGIGGIGMSALARYLHKAGVQVSGYDKTPTGLTAALIAEGIPIHFDDQPGAIPEDTDLVIYTPAVPDDLAEIKHIRQKGLPLKKRSEMLGEITAAKKTLAVAGTHGKTTVTTLISHLLYSGHQGCTSFLGGIAKNYNSNLLLQPDSPYMVAEADEFDRSFLRLFPWLAIITSADADHLDIYGDHNALKDSFAAFTSNIHEDGFLLIKAGVEIPIKAKTGVRIYRYSSGSPADFAIENLSLANGTYTFDLVTPGERIHDINPVLPGLFNVENSVAAAAAAYLCGSTADEIRNGIHTFTGVQRRFDQRINTPGLLYIDDYAHHPEELRACISSVRAIYPQRHITGIFQPHLYSRTRDFADGFAGSLSLLDRVILLDIYPARERPIAGVSSELIYEKITAPDKHLCSKQQALDLIQEKQPDILLTLGAGDIDQMVPEIVTIFKEKATAG